MRTVLVALVLAYSAGSSDSSSSEVVKGLKLPLKIGTLVPLDPLPGSIRYAPPSYSDVLDLVNKIQPFEVQRILGVYEQLVNGVNYWVVYQDVKDNLCVLYFNYRPWVQSQAQFRGTSKDCRSFLVIPNPSNKLVIKKPAQRSIIPLVYRRPVFDIDASSY